MMRAVLKPLLIVVLIVAVLADRPAATTFSKSSSHDVALFGEEDHQHESAADNADVSAIDDQEGEDFSSGSGAHWGFENAVSDSENEMVDESGHPISQAERDLALARTSGAIEGEGLTLTDFEQKKNDPSPVASQALNVDTDVTAARAGEDDEKSLQHQQEEEEGEHSENDEVPEYGGQGVRRNLRKMLLASGKKKKNRKGSGRRPKPKPSKPATEARQDERKKKLQERVDKATRRERERKHALNRAARKELELRQRKAARRESEHKKRMQHERDYRRKTYDPTVKRRHKRHKPVKVNKPPQEHKHNHRHGHHGNHHAGSHHDGKHHGGNHHAGDHHAGSHHGGKHHGGNHHGKHHGTHHQQKKSHKHHGHKTDRSKRDGTPSQDTKPSGSQSAPSGSSGSSGYYGHYNFGSHVNHHRAPMGSPSAALARAVSTQEAENTAEQDAESTSPSEVREIDQLDA